MIDPKNLEEKAKLVRKWILISTTAAGSGHPTSSLSATDIGTVLFDKFFNYDIKNPKNPNNDRFVLSKGHASPLLYSLFAISGGCPLEELKTLRKFGSCFEGHPTPEFRYSEITSGSLGQGLSIGAGMALALRARISNLPKVYVLLGDGECAEGSIWEAANFASYYKLDNLIAIVDVNRLGQSQETMFGHNISEYANRFKAFGWQTVRIDGHNLKEIEEALKSAVGNKSGIPTAIIAKTIKGKGVSFLENKDGWHGKALKNEDLEKALKELGEVDDKLRFNLRVSKKSAEVANENFLVHDAKNLNYSSSINNPANAHRENFVSSPRQLNSIFNFKKGEEIATREVYGKVLAELGKNNPLIYALDGDTKNSTFSEDFKKIHPDRFIECFIAEQNMISVSLGLSKMGKIPFASTFAAFLTRAFDQIRMSAISKGNIKVVGSHAGSSIGEDGASQMGLEDIAMFGALPGSIIFHPSDAVSASRLLPIMAANEGIFYLRTLRPKTPVIYDNNEEFKIGGSRVIHESKKDFLTVVAAGITVQEALKAYEVLKKKGILIRVIDCYSVKPIDKETLQKSVGETRKKVIITVEDHFEHGGLGDFVLSALSDLEVYVKKLAVRKIPRSGTKEELLNYVGIDAKSIIKAVESFV